MLAFLTKYKNVIVIIFALILLAFVYFEGKSAGKDAGYLEGYAKAEETFQQKLTQAIQERDIVKTQYEAFVANSNKRVSELEQQSIKLSNDRKAWMQKYNKLLSEQKMSEENAVKPAWTLETVKLINNML